MVQGGKGGARLLGQRVQHGVFPADVIGQHGHRGALAEAIQHIQIKRGGFHHQHIGGFGDVLGGLAQGLPRVGGIHLIGFFIPPQHAAAAHRVPKGAVEVRGKLGRIR